MTITEVEAIAQSRLTKWANKIQLQIFKTVVYTFKDELQSLCFNSNNGFKSNLFNVIEPALGDVVRCGPADTISKAELHALFQKDQ